MPSGPVSTVLDQVGCGCPSSNEVAKSVSLTAGSPGAAVAEDQPPTPPIANAMVETTTSDLLPRMCPIAHALRRTDPIFSEAKGYLTSLSSGARQLVRKPVRTLLRPIYTHSL
ncbi:hypothetical protein GCM10027184_38250 [Saccharothrix stipae]